MLERFPPIGQLDLTGHAHIDLAWLWPLSETRRKAIRTFSTVLSLMEQYPDFTFNQSTAQLYSFVEEDAPELFERIKARVKEGRWDVVGGMWVEPDGNLISGESWARQLLYGQRYFAEKFGKTGPRLLAARYLRLRRQSAATAATRQHSVLFHHQADLERDQYLSL